MEEPHWLVTALFGAFLGVLLPTAGRTAVYMRNRLKQVYLERQWFSYHISYMQGKPFLVKAIWFIKTGFAKRFVIDVRTTNTNLHYRGSIEIEGDNLIMYFACQDYPESPVFRYHYPTKANAKLLLGLWLSFDNDKYITAGPCLLSQSELEEDVATDFLTKSYRSESRFPLIRLERTEGPMPAGVKTSEKASAKQIAGPRRPDKG